MSSPRCRPKKRPHCARTGRSQPWTLTSWTPASCPPLLDPGHERHAHVRHSVQQLEQNAVLFLSTASLAELRYGVNLAAAFGHSRLPTLQQTLVDARRYPVLDITRHTADAYADLKATLARTYLPNAGARRRPRWIEDWVDKTTGQKLQIDENDLWMCAQAKERDLPLCTADSRMYRISSADPDVRLHIL